MVKNNNNFQPLVCIVTLSGISFMALPVATNFYKMENNRTELLKELKGFIDGGNAHKGFEDAVHGLPEKLRGAEVEHMPYTIWQLVYHIWIAQWDILEFSKGHEHKSPKWPEEYWPKNKAPKDDAEWEETIKKIEKDKHAFLALLEKGDLYTPFPHGNGQNLLREALLVGDHAAYHTSEIITMRRLLGDWN